MEKTYIETVTEEIKNIDMSNMLASLEPVLETATGKFGYAVARNIRMIRAACSEYIRIRQELVKELGKKEIDGDGNPTGSIFIKLGSEEHVEYERRISEYNDIKHTVEICKVSYEILPENVTAKDMLMLEWMLIE